MTNFINRILGDFDYLRGHTEMESAEVKDAFTDPGGVTHTGEIAGSSEWEVNTDGELVPKDGEPVSVGQLSNIALVDPDATDFATALDNAVSKVPAGGTVLVPGVTFAECSGTTLTKEVTVRSLGSVSRYYSDTIPTVTKTTDAPCIESGDDTAIAVIGLHFDASGIADTTPAVTGHGQTLIRDCNATEIGGDPVYYLHQATAGDNLNLSQVSNVSAEDCAGDVVMAENTTGNANNLNSLRIHVQDHKGNAGWAINTGLQDANASWFFVNSIQGGANATKGGIRMNSQRCYGRVLRHEGSGPPVQFEEPFNGAEILYNNTGNAPVWNNDNNVWIDRGKSGWNAETRYDGFNFRGYQSINIEDNNGNMVPVYGQNGGWRFMDTAGTDSLKANNGGFGTDNSGDLTGVTGDFDGQLKYDNGAGGNSTGYYRWDNANSQWAKIEDNTVTVT